MPFLRFILFLLSVGQLANALPPADGGYSFPSNGRVAQVVPSNAPFIGAIIAPESCGGDVECDALVGLKDSAGRLLSVSTKDGKIALGGALPEGNYSLLRKQLDYFRNDEQQLTNEVPFSVGAPMPRKFAAGTTSVTYTKFGDTVTATIKYVPDVSLVPFVAVAYIQTRAGEYSFKEYGTFDSADKTALVETYNYCNTPDRSETLTLSPALFGDDANLYPVPASVVQLTYPDCNTLEDSQPGGCATMKGSENSSGHFAFLLTALALVWRSKRKRA